ncbi:hypothetical protein ACET7V_20130 [Aeromonas sanarellii]
MLIIYSFPCELLNRTAYNTTADCRRKLGTAAIPTVIATTVSSEHDAKPSEKITLFNCMLQPHAAKKLIDKETITTMRW